MTGQPDECAAGCGVLLDPVLIHEGLTVHPGCAPGFAGWTDAESQQWDRVVGWLRRRPHKAEPRSTLYRPRWPGEAKAAPAEPDPTGPALRDTRNAKRVTRRPPARSDQTAGRKLPRSGTRTRTVFDLLDQAGIRGLCMSQIREQADDDTRQHAGLTQIVGQLVAGGHVIRAPKLREVPGGKHEAVWVAAVHAPEGTP